MVGIAVPISQMGKLRLQRLVFAFSQSSLLRWIRQRALIALGAGELISRKNWENMERTGHLCVPQSVDFGARRGFQRKGGEESVQEEEIVRGLALRWYT